MRREERRRGGSNKETKILKFKFMWYHITQYHVVPILYNVPDGSMVPDGSENQLVLRTNWF